MSYLRKILRNGITLIAVAALIIISFWLIFNQRQAATTALQPTSESTPTDQPIRHLRQGSPVVTTPTPGYTPPRSGIVGKIIVSPTPGTPTSTPIPTSTPPYSEKVQVQDVVDLEQQFIDEYRAGNLSTLTDKVLDVDEIKVKFESWSPDGQYMLLMVGAGEFLEGKNVTDPPGVLRGRVGVYDLWLADASGILLSLLAETAFWHAWSPDGAAIAYIHRTVDDGIFDNQLWIMQADGSNHKKLLSGARSVAWLDNKTVVFIDSDNEQLHLIDSDGQNVRPLVIEGLAPEYSKVVLYALSPDRQKLAFDSRGDNKLRIAALDGDQISLVTEIEVPDLSLMSWSPDSKRLAFSHLCSKPQQNSACRQIYIAQPDGAIVTRIDHRPDTTVTWSPDGRWVVFQETNRVYVADTESGEFQILHTFPSGKQNTTDTIHWSPTGERIGLNQESSGNAIILLIQIAK